MSRLHVQRPQQSLRSGCKGPNLVNCSWLICSQLVPYSCQIQPLLTMKLMSKRCEHLYVPLIIQVCCVDLWLYVRHRHTSSLQQAVLILYFVARLVYIDVFYSLALPGYSLLWRHRTVHRAQSNTPLAWKTCGKQSLPFWYVRNIFTPFTVCKQIPF